MSNLSATEAVCAAAEVECYDAAAVLPPAFACGRLVAKGKADAGLVHDAGATWRDTHRALVDAATDLRRIVAAVPDDVWSGKDRAAYEDRVAEFDRQCHDLAAYAEAGGIALEALAYGLAAFAVVASGVAVALTSTAAYVLAADATVVGAPAAEALGNAVSSYGLSVMRVAAATLEVAMRAGAAVFTAGELLDVRAELRHGSDTVLPDFVQAEVTAGLDGLEADLEGLPEDTLDEKLDEAAGLDE
jgi:hypothetical protein